ncbi:hypothetical protein [Psychrobacter sp. I-STPA6b]|uniref:hypothetical protein n=1 Tax=Psychrobacter sp. I-STPA6b TaxID=2585718 RepID=UPI001D0C326D|nr:hypothetical protein [Psychrobacter sp. I-STPA6b]
MPTINKKKILLGIISIPIIIFIGWCLSLAYLLFIEVPSQVHNKNILSTSLSAYAETTTLPAEDIYQVLNDFKDTHHLNLHELSELVALIDINGLIHQYRFKGDIYPAGELQIFPQRFTYRMSSTGVNDTDDELAYNNLTNTLVITDPSMMDINSIITTYSDTDICHISLLIFDKKHDKGQARYLSTKNSFGTYLSSDFYNSHNLHNFHDNQPENQNSQEHQELQTTNKTNQPNNSNQKSKSNCFYQQVLDTNNFSLKRDLPDNINEAQIQQAQILVDTLNTFKQKHHLANGTVAEVLSKSNLPTVELTYHNRYQDGDMLITSDGYQLPNSQYQTLTVNDNTSEQTMLVIIENSSGEQYHVISKPITDTQNMNLLVFIDNKAFIYPIANMNSVIIRQPKATGLKNIFNKFLNVFS